MKNKDKYNLKDLNFSVSYLTDGCGKKIEGMRYFTIKDGNNKLLSELVRGKALDRLIEWLEEEEK